jgi:tryptophan-rich sensory protein
VFPVVWPALNLTTATSAWLVWRAGEAGPGAPSRRAVLAWWAPAVPEIAWTAFATVLSAAVARKNS